MSLAISRFSKGDRAVVAVEVRNNARRFPRGEEVTVVHDPVDGYCTISDDAGHELPHVTEHALVGKGQPLPGGVGLLGRRVRTFVATHFGPNEG